VNGIRIKVGSLYCLVVGFVLLRSVGLLIIHLEYERGELES
jgi:hypothetical protein